MNHGPAIVNIAAKGKLNSMSYLLIVIFLFSHRLANTLFKGYLIHKHRTLKVATSSC